MKRGSSTGSVKPVATSGQKPPLLRPFSRLGARSTEGITKLDVEDLLAHISSAEKADFEKNWFAQDSKRRLQQFCSGGAVSFKIDEMETQVLHQMFPTLSLDMMLQDRSLPAITTAEATLSLMVLFDADGDGCIDEEEFTELMKFCFAWRSTFYSPAARTSSRPSTSSSIVVNRPPPTPMTKTVPRSSSSAQGAGGKLGLPKDAVRRASGFGPRQFNGDSQNTLRPVRRPSIEKPGSRQSSAQSQRSGSKKSSVSPSREPSSERLHIEKMSDAQLDASRGAFYSSSFDMRRQSLSTQEFVEWLEERCDRNGTLPGLTIEERQGHPLRSYVPPKPMFAGDKVRRSSAVMSK
jgi:hypothetical protein